MSNCLYSVSFDISLKYKLYIHYTDTVYMYVFLIVWEFTKSADCVVQNEDIQNACQSAHGHATLCTCTICTYVYVRMYVCIYACVCVCACVRDSVVVIL